MQEMIDYEKIRGFIHDFQEERLLRKSIEESFSSGFYSSKWLGREVLDVIDSVNEESPAIYPGECQFLLCFEIPRNP
jgi:hypothetical protein